ncbi:MAG: GFA family protein [Gammaproteobacteria bacterium]
MNTDRNAAVDLKGGCLCGAVRYEVSIAPAIAGFCYCESCRKLSGSGHAFLALVPEAAMKISGNIRGFEWKADSGNTVTTSFCPTCGSPLFGKNSGMPDMVAFRVASLDDPDAISPQMAVYTKRVLSWDCLDPALPAFREMPPMPQEG